MVEEEPPTKHRYCQLTSFRICWCSILTEDREDFFTEKGLGSRLLERSLDMKQKVVSVVSRPAKRAPTTSPLRTHGLREAFAKVEKGVEPSLFARKQILKFSEERCLSC